MLGGGHPERKEKRISQMHLGPPTLWFLKAYLDLVLRTADPWKTVRKFDPTQPGRLSCPPYNI